MRYGNYREPRDFVSDYNPWEIPTDPKLLEEWDLAVPLFEIAEANREVIADIYSLLPYLTEKQRKLIDLFFFSKLTQEEIAKKLGVGQSAVSLGITAACERLRNLYSVRCLYCNDRILSGRANTRYCRSCYDKIRGRKNYINGGI